MLNKILEAREQRSEYRNLLGEMHRGTVVTFTINIPWGEKSNPKYGSWLCALEMEEFTEAMGKRHGAIKYRELRMGNDGPEGFMVVDGKPEDMKRLGITIEDCHPLGRLFDIDLAGIKRTDYGCSSRRCLVCNGTAANCIVRRIHSKEEIFHAIDELICKRNDRISAEVSEQALRAVLHELSCTPKPGLVDRNDSGPHDDMDYFTFLNSISTLPPYFHGICSESLKYDNDQDSFLRRIITMGLNAERAMFEATGGINTQKGQIFSLGLACSAASQTLRKVGRGRIETISDIIAKSAEHILAINNELQRVRGNTQIPAHGEIVYKTLNITGIKGEAIRGFPSAVKTGLPAFKYALSQGAGFNESMLHCLISLMHILEDTNVLYRGGLDALSYLHESTKTVLEKGSVLTDEGRNAIERLNTKLTEKNISTGGSADMLALTMFLYFIERLRL